jgi:hypothetical protein
MADINKQIKKAALEIQLQRLEYIKEVGVKNFYEGLRYGPNRTRAPLVDIDPKLNMLGTDRP